MKFIKHAWRFLREYKLLSLAATALVTGLALQLGGLHTVSHIILAVVSILEVLVLGWNMWQECAPEPMVLISWRRRRLSLP